MNIKIPDSWLREYLETEATPTQIKEYLSLCGPSVERIHKIGNEMVYEVEITSNRPDSMSVAGVAREAAAILPRFGIEAKLVADPYQKKNNATRYTLHVTPKLLHIVTNPKLNPRWTSVIIDNVKIGPSPKWLQKKLELTGIRSLNNIIDITNYLLRSFGQPAHVFDYDEIKPGKDGIPTMILRTSKKGEKLTTLDGKTHTLPGGDIVIEDGSGRLIDLCGIMGAENSAIKSSTKTIVLFMQTYDPAQIRKTQMALSHRSEAGSLFEKGLDSELVLPTIHKGIELVKELAGGKIASEIYDIYPKPYKPYEVSVARAKLNSYMGIKLTDQEIAAILDPLGFIVDITSSQVIVSVPSFRRDIEIDVDLVEEIARIFGFHSLKNRLPDTEPPIVFQDPILKWEEEVKTRLRDWGFTETYTYSMISDELMDIFGLDKSKTYKIANPLSSEWVYMRPSVIPSMLNIIKENLDRKKNLQLFELSMYYKYRENDLPVEKPTLIVAWTGEKFCEAKGLAEILFDLFGIKFPQNNINNLNNWFTYSQLTLDNYGCVGFINSQILTALNIKNSITILDLDIELMVKNAQNKVQYKPIPKYPPVIEDLSFVLPPKTPLGIVIQTIKNVSPLVHSVGLIGQYKNTSTFRLSYLDINKPLTNEEVEKVRTNIIAMVKNQYKAVIKEDPETSSG